MVVVVNKVDRPAARAEYARQMDDFDAACCAAAGHRVRPWGPNAIRIVRARVFIAPTAVSTRGLAFGL